LAPKIPKSELANDCKPDSVNWKDGIKILKPHVRQWSH
jgi:hypothetical protein